jgi:hypothetical protein
MTIQDVPTFRRELQETALVLGTQCDEDRAEAYWEALKDIHLDVFERACAEGRKEWRRFPVPSSIREVAERIRPSIYRPPPPRVTEDNELLFHCLNCQDTGLQPVRTADRRPIRFDAMTGSHADYAMRRCQCRESNPGIQARWAAMKRIAAPATQRWGG